MTFALLLRQKCERHCGEDADECSEVVPADAFAKVEDRKSSEDRERDDFLDDLQLGGGIDRVALAIGRHLKTVFESGNAPTCEDHDEQRFAFEFEMPIPRKRHEDVRANE